MMKLGTQTGSLINHVMSMGASGNVEIGSPASILSWSDRSPATVTDIIKVGKSTIVEVQDDDYTVVGGPYGYGDHINYEYTRNPEGYKNYFRFDEKNGWVRVYKNSETGRWVKSSGSGLIIGCREKYSDPSF